MTGLENGTRYAFELRVRRDSGFGTAAKIRQTPGGAALVRVDKPAIGPRG